MVFPIWACKEETSVACTAPFRRQGFGHVMSESICVSVNLFDRGKAAFRAGEIQEKQRRSQNLNAKFNIV